jgi:mannose-1-phosphate guanylyltransferase/mannose-6-phosphate isomerase
MFVLEAGWSDLGSWDAVWKNGLHDDQGNAVVGDVHLFETKDSLVYAGSRLVSVLGCKNLVVIETNDAILIIDREKSQDVKKIVAKLDSQRRNENLMHRKVSRPWGWFDTLEEHGRFKVKRILVNPGARLSLQMHKHRAEHWIVVSGLAEITNGDKVIVLHENESTFIPCGQIHRLANIGLEPLEIIEVQSGGYLGEDDIIRLDDSYGRS